MESTPPQGHLGRPIGTPGTQTTATEDQPNISNWRGPSGANTQKAPSSDCFPANFQVRDPNSDLIKTDLRDLPMITMRVWPSKEESTTE